MSKSGLQINIINGFLWYCGVSGYTNSFPVCLSKIMRQATRESQNVMIQGYLHIGFFLTNSYLFYSKNVIFTGI